MKKFPCSIPSLFRLRTKTTTLQQTKKMQIQIKEETKKKQNCV